MKNRSEVSFRSGNEGETGRIARSLASVLPKQFCLTLDGNLGAGKTNFTASLVHALDKGAEISSPTFTIVQEYGVDSMRPIFHFDLYRLDDADAFYEAGLEEYFSKDGLSIIEWSDKMPEVLPKDRLRILFEVDNSSTIIDFGKSSGTSFVLEQDERSRLIHMQIISEQYGDLLERWSKEDDFPADLVEK